MLSSSGQFFFSFILCLWNVDFWKAYEKMISVIYKFAYFPFVVSFMCKSCRKGSILMEPPPPLPLKDSSSTFFIDCTTMQYGSIKYMYFSLIQLFPKKNSLQINVQINHRDSVFTHRMDEHKSFVFPRQYRNCFSRMNNALVFRN